MRSGIGPAGQLRALGIDVLRDVPAVGRHLMDHPILRASIALNPEHRARGADARHTNCCVTYSSGLAGGGERDMILIAYNHRGLTEDGGLRTEGAIGIALYDAFSRGELRLTSADPEAQPEVDENMLDDPRDRVRMRDGVRRLARLVARDPVARIAQRIRFGENGLSMQDAAALPDDDALDALMLRDAADIQHAAGTCRMTAHEDPRGVVDPDLRVRGVDRAARGGCLDHADRLPRQPALHLRDDRGDGGAADARLMVFEPSGIARGLGECVQATGPSRFPARGCGETGQTPRPLPLPPPRAYLPPCSGKETP
jgi:choline dehydrogenase-like flavoprotein